MSQDSKPDEYILASPPVHNIASPPVGPPTPALFLWSVRSDYSSYLTTTCDQRDEEGISHAADRIRMERTNLAGENAHRATRKPSLPCTYYCVLSIHDNHPGGSVFSPSSTFFSLSRVPRSLVGCADRCASPVVPVVPVKTQRCAFHLADSNNALAHAPRYAGAWLRG